jgi:hypothetical protein
MLDRGGRLLYDELNITDEPATKIAFVSGFRNQLAALFRHNDGGQVAKGKRD